MSEDEIVFGASLSPRKSGWKHGRPRCSRCSGFLSGHGAWCRGCGSYGSYNHGETR